MAVKLYPDNPDMKAIDNIVSLLRDGGIIIYPTDTVYAIGCDIRQARAVERICHFKKIDSKKARFTMLCDDISSASEYARIDNDTFKLLKANLPGPFTFILNGSSRLPKLLKNRNTIGIRIPDNNIIRTIVRELGNPMLTTSLKNLHGRIRPVDGAPGGGLPILSHISGPMRLKSRSMVPSSAPGNSRNTARPMT